MTSALIFSAIMLGIVLVTQIGTRRHYLVLAVMPFVSCVVIGGLVLGTGDHHYTGADFVAGAVGAVLGIGVGLAMSRGIRVWRLPATGKAYTRAGIGYLAVWLAVLLSRIVFVWLLTNNDDVARAVGRFMADTGLNGDGIALFFVLMALVMVVVREISILVRSARLHGTQAGDGARGPEPRETIAL